MKKLSKMNGALSRNEMRNVQGGELESAQCISWTGWCQGIRDAKQCCSGLECRGGSCDFIDWLEIGE